MDKYTRLDWDSNFFGYEVWALKSDNLSEVELKELLDVLKIKSAKVVYWFSEKEKLFSNKYYNGTLADIKIIYVKELQESTSLSYNIRSFLASEKYDNLIPLALQSGVYSRFKTDINFSNCEFEKMYIQWIKKSVNREIANEVFVYQENDRILGMVTVKINNDKAIIGLIAVDENTRGKGIGAHLTAYAENYAKSKGCKSMEVATQKMNEQACSFYSKQGFEVSQTNWIYHFWLK